MIQLKGTFTANVDSAGRFYLPSIFRDGLGHSCTIIKGIGCLWMITASMSEKILKELDSAAGGTLKGMFNPKLSVLRRHIFSGMTELTPSSDKNYRIQLTPEQRRYAKIDDSVILIGAGDYVEIWCPSELDIFEDSNNTSEIVTSAVADLFAAIEGTENE